MSGSADIAIIGMAGLFPKAPNIDAFWSNILNGVDAISEASDDWLGEPKLFDPDASPEELRIYTKRGGFLGELSRFDPRPFGAMPVSIQGGEPDQFLALKCAQGALEHAGYGAAKDFNRERTGCILGHAIHANRANINGFQHALIVDQVMSVISSLNPGATEAGLGEVEKLLRAKLPKFSVDTMPALVPNMMTGRICNRLNLMGPNYIMDAACASTPLAIDAAINELRSNRADLMLAGGVNTTTSTLVYAVFCQLGALTRGEKLRPFSAAADGTLLGEGQGIFVLKRLEDALADDDRVLAVIKSVGASSDGRSSGLMAPRLEGEELAIRRAYEQSGVDPLSVDLVEAHGTGIPLGDKTEVSALRKVFGERKKFYPEIALGSVKSMIGHCIPAAGAASIIKMVMALNEQILPPTLCEEVSPELGLEATPFYINTQTRPWPHDPSSPRRAAVNAFGFGGVNSHVLLEESPQAAPDHGAAFGIRRKTAPELFCFAAENRPALLEILSAAQAKTAEAGDFGAYADQCAKAAGQGGFRLAVVAADWADLKAKLENAVSKIGDDKADAFSRRNGVFFRPRPLEGKIAFLFPGEHSQYPGMLADIAIHSPLARRWLDRLEGLYGGARATSHRHLLYPPPTILTDEEGASLEDRLAEVAEGSEAVFFVDMAYFALLTAFGVKPDFMIGHSTGENAALVASGVVRLNDDEVCDYIRSMNRIFEEIEKAGVVPNGVLLTVGAAEEEDFEAALSCCSDIVFTMDNCPNQKIIFGGEESIKTVARTLSSKGAICTKLPLAWAYHTEFVKPLADGFSGLFASIGAGPSDVRLYSCSTAQPYPAEEDAIRETMSQQYMTRVRFTDAIRNMHEDGARLFIEVGAENSLTGFVRDILGEKDFTALSCDNPKRDSMTGLLTLLGQLFTAGVFDPQKATPARMEAADHMKDPYLPSILPLIHLEEEEAKKARLAVGASLSAGVLASPANNGAAGKPSSPSAPRVEARTPVIADWSGLLGAGSHTSIYMARLPGPLADHAQFYETAQNWLSDAEYRYGAETVFQRSLLRKREWLCGRIAAKHAIRRALGVEDIDFRALTILPDDMGRPLVHAELSGAAALQISISHKDGVAISAASQFAIGVDFEKCSGLHDPYSFSERVLNDDERAFIDEQSDYEQSAILFWSMKEAAAKAFGEPFVGQEKAFSVDSINIELGCAHVLFGDASAFVNYRLNGEYAVVIAALQSGGA